MGRDSGETADAFKLLKMFVKGKGAFQFESPHDGEACAVGKTEILVGVSIKNSKSRLLNRRGNCDNFNEGALLQVLPEKNSDKMKEKLGSKLNYTLHLTAEEGALGQGTRYRKLRGNIFICQKLHDRGCP